MSKAVSKVRWRAPRASKVSYTPLNTQILRYNAQIEKCSESGNLERALMLAKELKEKLKDSPWKPDLTTYNALAKGFAHHGLAAEALRLIDDARASGVEPDVNLWNQILKAHVVSDAPVEPVLQNMAEANIERNSLTKHLLVQRHVNNRELEAAIASLVISDMSGMSSDKLGTPRPAFKDLSDASLQTITAVVNLAMQVRETRLAADLMIAYEKSAARRLPEELYITLMSSSVGTDDASSALLGFERLANLSIEMDEGLATSLLNLFARHELLEPCERIVNVHLPRILQKTPLREWHLTPLITVYTGLGRIQDAVRVFTRLSTTQPSSSSTPIIEPSYKVFLEGFTTPDQLQIAVTEIVRLAEGSSDVELPIQLINAALRACILQGQREHLQQLKDLILDRPDETSTNIPQPNIDTFNILFSACLPASAWTEPDARNSSPDSSDEETASLLLDLMKDQYPHLTPTRASYSTIIEVYAGAPSTDWQLAFDHLEEMKHFDMLPPPHVYTAILSRLLRESAANSSAIDKEGAFGDAREDRRIGPILREMASLGYLGRTRKHDNGRNILNRDLRAAVGMERVEQVLRGVYRQTPEPWLEAKSRRSQQQNWAPRPR